MKNPIDKVVIKLSKEYNGIEVAVDNAEEVTKALNGEKGNIIELSAILLDKMIRINKKVGTVGFSKYVFTYDDAKEEVNTPEKTVVKEKAPTKPKVKKAPAKPQPQPIQVEPENIYGLVKDSPAFNSLVQDAGKPADKVWLLLQKNKNYVEIFTKDGFNTNDVSKGPELLTYIREKRNEAKKLETLK